VTPCLLQAEKFEPQSKKKEEKFTPIVFSQEKKLRLYIRVKFILLLNIYTLNFSILPVFIYLNFLRDFGVLIGVHCTVQS